MQCRDQARGAVDNGGDGCEWYVGSNTQYCSTGTFDDDDFTAWDTNVFESMMSEAVKRERIDT